jgi:hypothetical protein
VPGASIDRVLLRSSTTLPWRNRDPTRPLPCVDRRPDPVPCLPREPGSGNGPSARARWAGPPDPVTATAMPPCATCAVRGWMDASLQAGSSRRPAYPKSFYRRLGQGSWGPPPDCCVLVASARHASITCASQFFSFFFNYCRRGVWLIFYEAPGHHRSRAACYLSKPLLVQISKKRSDRPTYASVDCLCQD